MTFEIGCSISKAYDTCKKCGAALEFGEEIVRCPDCAAEYHRKNIRYNGEKLVCEYEFINFKCMYQRLRKFCPNDCPSPGMYCKEHIGDQYINELKASIDYHKKFIATSEKDLSVIDESKRIWLITELSGIEEKNE